jgi:hypothetical protein
MVASRPLSLQQPAASDRHRIEVVGREFPALATEDFSRAVVKSST